MQVNKLKKIIFFTKKTTQLIYMSNKKSIVPTWIVFAICKLFYDGILILLFAKRCSPYRLVNPSAISTLRWHFDFYIVKIGMPQKGLEKRGGV